MENPEKLPLQKDIISKGKWDVLIVLDACRYDVFKALFHKEFNIKPVISSGSCTIEWFYKTFTRKYDDVVYVSGNPYISRFKVTLGDMSYVASKFFYHLTEGWREGWRSINGIFTVCPKTLTLIAKTVANLYKSKRLIIHFLQPHAPYPLCDSLRKYFVNDKGSPDKYLWKALRNNEVDKKLAFECYVRNLKWVMTYVEDLINFFKDKKIVITSDHQEFFGENGIYNHPCGLKDSRLRIVPWAIKKSKK